MGIDHTCIAQRTEGCYALRPLRFVLPYWKETGMNYRENPVKEFCGLRLFGSDVIGVDVVNTWREQL